jgi:hypothetical protein
VPFCQIIVEIIIIKKYLTSALFFILHIFQSKRCNLLPSRAIHIRHCKHDLKSHGSNENMTNMANCNRNRFSQILLQYVSDFFKMIIINKIYTGCPENGPLTTCYYRVSNNNCFSWQKKILHKIFKTVNCTYFALFY